MRKPTKLSLEFAKKLAPGEKAQQKRIALALRQFIFEENRLLYLHVKALKDQVKELKQELKDIRKPFV